MGFLPKTGWEVVNGKDDPMVRQALLMSPAAARRAITYLDDKNAKVREDVYLALMDRACQESKPGEPPIRRLAEIMERVVIPMPEAFDPAKYKTGGGA